MSQIKGRQVFQEKNRGVTPLVAVPGVTHPSDATVDSVVACVCVCGQLTDNTSLATAGAVQRFLASCRFAILQANYISIDAAFESIITRNETMVVDVYYTPEIETLNRISCPLCLPARPVAECCGNGQCANGTCHCNTGWFIYLLKQTHYVQSDKR